MWYVVLDDEGPWLVEEVSEGDEVVFQSENQLEAEIELCRCCNEYDGELSFEE